MRFTRCVRSSVVWRRPRFFTGCRVSNGASFKKPGNLKAALVSLQGAQEIQQVLLLIVRKRIVEQENDSGCLRPAAGVLLNGLQEAAVGRRGAAIVKEKDALAEPPQRRGAEFARSGALRNI